MMQNIILIFLLYLPFQVALNPLPGIDLASIRLIIPLMALIWLIHSLKSKKIIINSSKQTLLLLSFAFFAIFSVFFADNIQWSLRKLMFLFSILPVYFLITIFIHNEFLKKKAIYYLVLSTSFLAFIGILQFLAQFIFGLDNMLNFWSQVILPFLGNSFGKAVSNYPSWLVNISGKTYMRAIAIFPDPHMLAFYLGMILPWSIALFFEKKEKLHFLSFPLLILTSDLLTFSRGGYLGIFFGIITIIPFAWISFKRKNNETVSKLFSILNRHSSKFFLFFISALFLLLVFTNNPISQRFTATFDLKEGSNSERIRIWKQAATIIMQNPFGVGIGNYSLAIKSDADYRDPIYAHSIYLDIAAELGIFTLILWIAFLWHIGLAYYKKFLTDKYYLAGIVSIAIFAGHAIVENPLFSVHVFSLLLILAAISTSNESHA